MTTTFTRAVQRARRLARPRPLAAVGVATLTLAGCQSSPETCDPAEGGLFNALRCQEQYDARIDALEQERAAAAAEVDATRARSEAKEAEIVATSEAFARLVGRHDRLRAQTARLRAKLGRLSGDQAAAETDLRAALAELAALGAEAERFSATRVAPSAGSEDASAIAAETRALLTSPERRQALSEAARAASGFGANAGAASGISVSATAAEAARRAEALGRRLRP